MQISKEQFNDPTDYYLFCEKEICHFSIILKCFPTVRRYRGSADTCFASL